VVKNGVRHVFVADGDGASAGFVANVFPVWEQHSFEAFARLADPDAVAIDLGAWIGTTCISLSALFMAVVAVEPDPVSAEALRRNLAASECGNVIVQQCACVRWPVPAVRLAPSPGGVLNESTSRIVDSGVGVFVPGISFGHVVRIAQSRGPVRLVKVDIEGSEELILQDLIEFLTSTAGSVALVSFHVPWWRVHSVFSFRRAMCGLRARDIHGVDISDTCRYISDNPWCVLELSAVW
jgi:FkbM family methyltransferase